MVHSAVQPAVVPTLCLPHTVLTSHFFFFMMVVRMYGYSFSTAAKRGIAQKKSCEHQGNEGWGSMEGDLNRNSQTIQ